MDSRMPADRWEDVIRAAVRVGDADPAFARRLRGELMRKAVPVRSLRRTPIPRPLWMAAIGAVSVLLGALLLFGPEKVAAALQSLLGYIPGVGFVRTDTPFRILADQVKVEKSGAVLFIRQVVADQNRTVVVFEVDCPGPETQWLKTGTFCIEGEPALRLADGTLLRTDGRFGQVDRTYYRERAEFPPLPATATSVTLILKVSAAPGEPGEPWLVDLPLTPSMQEATLYPVMMTTPLRAGDPAATPSPDGIDFSLDRVVAMEEVILLQGGVDWDPARYTHAEVDFTSLEITDSAGRECPWEFADADPLLGGEEDRALWAIRFNHRSRPGPFRLKAGSMIVEKLVRASFEMDFGPAPQPGQIWALDIPLRLDGYDVRVTYAKMDIRGGTRFVVFSFEGNEPVFFEAIWKDADQSSDPFGGGTGEPSTVFGGGAEYDQFPTGRHTIRIESITVRIQGAWTIPFDVEPVAQSANPSGP